MPQCFATTGAHICGCVTRFRTRYKISSNVERYGRSTIPKRGMRECVFQARCGGGMIAVYRSHIWPFYTV